MSHSRSGRLLRVLPLVAVAIIAAAVLFGRFGSPLDLFARPAPESARPPLTPRWVYEPWVWEDEENTVDAVLALIDGYRQRDIPVGTVIIDSPWQTNYNTFQLNANYGNPEDLMRRLRERNVRVIFWATGFINTESNDGVERGQAANYAEAFQKGYLVDGGAVYEWDKGKGSAVDFFNPDAVAWWYTQMDRAWAYGIDGWKVDAPEGNLPDTVQTYAGPKSNREYGYEYYRAFYRYVIQKRPDAIITARPVDSGTVYAPVDANPAGWVGDQEPDWGPRGIEEALDSILASAELGYSTVGSDIGGYKPGERFDKVFTRWLQLGAMSPLMENGGRGEHRPWKLDEKLVAPYRYFAKLHSQLVPYFYGLGVEASQGGPPIIRDPDRTKRQYRLGEDIFVAPIVTRDDRRRVDLPSGERWYDFFDDKTATDGGTALDYRAPSERMPIFIRAGAIIPMQVVDGLTGHGGPGSNGALTLLLYPEGQSRRTVRPDEGREIAVESVREGGSVSVTIGPTADRLVLRIKAPSRPSGLTLSGGSGGERPPAELSDFVAFDAAGGEGWFHDATQGYLWVRFAGGSTTTTLRYSGAP